MSNRSVIRDFAVIYGALAALKAIPRLRPKQGLRRNSQILLQTGQDTEIFRHTTFVLGLPRVFAFLKRRVPNDDCLPIAISSLLIYLVKPSYRRTIVIYAAQVAVLNFKRNHMPNLKVPPAWTLLLASNAWLLWAFLFNREAFPRGYGELILKHSGYGSEIRTEDLLNFLKDTKFEIYPEGELSRKDIGETKVRTSIHPSHTRAACSRLHPADPSCLSTFTKAWISQYPQVFQWVAALGLVPILLRRKTLNLGVFKRWLLTSIQGTAFVVGSINTSWALTCLLQRILPPHRLPRLRWLANGFLGSLWVLALPENRRKDFALYTSRLAITSTWDLWDSYSPRILEALVLLAAWASLIHDKRAVEGPKGLAALVLDYIDKCV
ncbi:hypothetical protein M422DRAFT_777539 [Sphaerobolus stellatus SS14]|nr:hypothetical protein M422DRAFT_777539 [Sphaerobolus stellatus SS14]